MPAFGRNSSKQLVTLHHDLQIILTELVEVYDISITQGARTVEDQIRNIRNGASKTLNSRHIPRDPSTGKYDPNAPACAADVIPWQKGVNPWPTDDDSRVIREKKKGRLYFMQGRITEIARRHSIKIRQGVDWDGDSDFFDQKFDDLPHVELLLIHWPKLVVEGALLEEANEALLSRELPAYG